MSTYPEEFKMLEERTEQLQAENEKLTEERDRYKQTLNQLQHMTFITDKTNSLGLRINEMIRSTFHPDEPCPNCNGTGQVPNEPRECFNCKFYHEYPMGGGSCGPWGGKRVECHEVCDKFEFSLPMLTCPVCGRDETLKGGE